MYNAIAKKLLIKKMYNTIAKNKHISMQSESISKKKGKKSLKCKKLYILDSYYMTVMITYKYKI